MYRVRSASIAGVRAEIDLPDMAAIGRLIKRDAAPFHLVLEGLYVAPIRAKTKKQRMAQRAKQISALKLAESAGEILGGMRRGISGYVVRPTANKWRADVMRLPGDMSAKLAEAKAVEWARRYLMWDAELPRTGLTYAEEGAVCEAACMSVWGQECR